MTPRIAKWQRFNQRTKSQGPTGMGEKTARFKTDVAERRRFAARLLNDVRAIEIMVANGLFESGVRKIGAEQEFCVVDANFRPSILGPEVLAAINESHFTTEVARYTLETNLDPLPLKGEAFSQMEKQLNRLLAHASQVAAQFDCRVVLAGILPSIGMSELEQRFMSPAPRYAQIQERIRELRGGGDIELSIQGIDDLMLRHDNILFEACNTSFQVHLQIDPEDFVDSYNWAQAISGPVLSLATNSPLFFGRELWAETRIALFKQSVDTRTRDLGLRQRQARVYFGTRWLRHSLAEIFQEDIMRYPLFLSTDVEDSLEALKAGRVPSLKALALHNGTIWKWNRPCFGASGDKAHLRLENRYLPAGPSTVDEFATAAFWVGLMCAMPGEFRQIWKRMDFLEAKDNFLKAAEHGLEVEMTWLGRTCSAAQLIIEYFLPMAEAGLRKHEVSSRDIDHYLGIIRARAEKRMTGSRWLKNAWRMADPELEQLQKQTALTAALWEHQRSGKPVTEWPQDPVTALQQGSIADERVDLLMATDLITVSGDDLLEMVARIMEWRGVRHVPVEDDRGELSGIITANDLARFCREHSCRDVSEIWTAPGQELRVAQLLVKDPVVIGPDTTAGRARQIMIERGIGCLPVIRNKKLVGLITKHDILRLEKKALLARE